ncbi:thymidylate synthase [Williamsia sp. M5A3_1d]
MYRNLTDAFVDVVARIHTEGTNVVARGQHQKELLSQLLTISHPHERVMIIPVRNNNVFAQVAETLWVLHGRNDIAYLSRYLPRAAEFSDDGLTWRAGYGPRLRNWNGEVDQVTAVADRIGQDLNTKRAVMSIFDPAVDYTDTKDVPCNNWLHFIRRGIDLHLNVSVRANDAFWGFSGINYFEWSVLHELMANVTGSSVGNLSWFAGSLHIYERHYSKAWQIAEAVRGTSVYDFGVEHLPVTSDTVAAFDADLATVFAVEDAARAGDHRRAIADLGSVSDAFLHDAGLMLVAYNMFLDDVSRGRIVEVINEMRPSDLRTASAEYLLRRWKQNDPGYLGLDLSDAEASFLRTHFAAVSRLVADEPRLRPTLIEAT